MREASLWKDIILYIYKYGPYFRISVEGDDLTRFKKLFGHSEVIIHETIFTLEDLGLIRGTLGDDNDSADLTYVLTNDGLEYAKHLEQHQLLETQGTRANILNSLLVLLTGILAYPGEDKVGIQFFFPAIIMFSLGVFFFNRIRFVYRRLFVVFEGHWYTGLEGEMKKRCELILHKKNLSRVIGIILIASSLSYFQYRLLLDQDSVERFYLLSIGLALVLLNTGLAYLFYYIATRYAVLISKYRWLSHATPLVALVLCFLWLSADTGYVLLGQRACRDGFGAAPIIPDCFIEPYYTSVLSLGYQLPVYYQYVLPLIYGLIGYGFVIIVGYIVRRLKR